MSVSTSMSLLNIFEHILKIRNWIVNLRNRRKQDIWPFQETNF